MLTGVFLALAAGVAATTITKARVFAPLRQRARGWLGYLLSCPYCASHWLVIAGQAYYQVNLAHLGPIVSTLPIIGAAVLVPALLTRLYSFSDEKTSWTAGDLVMKGVFHG